MAIYFIFSFIMKKKSRGKHLFESKKFKKLKLTDRNKVFKNKKYGFQKTN